MARGAARRAARAPRRRAEAKQARRAERKEAKQGASRPLDRQRELVALVGVLSPRSQAEIAAAASHWLGRQPDAALDTPRDRLLAAWEVASFLAGCDVDEEILAVTSLAERL
ncbi:MAG: hypothetical protein R3F59_05225 [Myxococcota bacterium]